MTSILVTGGAGYIGSHTVVELMQTGHQVTIIDNLCNSQISVIDRLEKICGQRPTFIEGDIRDAQCLDRALASDDFASVIHFAGLKAVGESVAQPLNYYDNNVTGTLRLLEAMGRAGLKNLVFSSSATVYGDPEFVPLTESAKLGATNPYGRSKLMIEEVLRDLAVSDPDWRIALLRYFNPVGAHASGTIGESPNGMPNNLMPFVTQVAVGLRPQLSVFGSDYPTPDGTGVRDYIHVVDLALGHLAALRYLENNAGVLTVNLGTGRGYSVLEVIRAFEAASGKRVPYQLVARRPGDVAQCYADPARAAELLGWRAKRDMAQMCQDSWRWQQFSQSLGAA